MVFGLFQAGKSTFLKSITGNGAYVTGKGHTSETKGVNMDGPYYPSDLQKQIPRELLNKIQNKSKNPAIFFVDSQGLGDRSANEIKPIIERVHSVFCSISTICIHVTKENEHEQVFKESLQIIEQMKMIDAHLGHTIFLIRGESQGEINSLLSESYELAKKELETHFTHKEIIKQCLPKDASYSFIPFGDLSHPDAYRNTIKNSIFEILNIIQNLNQFDTRDTIVESFINEVGYIFSGKFEELFKGFNKNDFPEDIRNDTFAMRIYALTKLFLADIDEANKKFTEEKKPDEERLAYYDKNVEFFKKHVSYIVKKEMLLHVNDKQQCIYDFSKCIENYVGKIEPLYKNRKIQIIGTAAPIVTAAGFTTASAVIGATSATVEVVAPITELTAIAIPAMTSSAAAICVPVFGIVAGLAFIGGCSYFAYTKYNEYALKKIKEKRPQLTLPFLWNKYDKKAQKKEKTLIISDGIVKSKVNKNNVILALENLEETNTIFYPMKFIIQSLTGYFNHYDDINYSRRSSEAVLLGPFKPNDLILRTSRVDSIYEAKTNDDIYILYLRNCKYQFDYDNIISVMTTIKMSESNKVPSNIANINKTRHLFCFENELQECPITKSNFNGLKSSTCRKLQDFSQLDNQINIWPIVIFDYNNPGPTTNKTLKTAFHHIFERRKKEKKDQKNSINRRESEDQ